MKIKVFNHTDTDLRPFTAEVKEVLDDYIIDFDIEKVEYKPIQWDDTPRGKRVNKNWIRLNYYRKALGYDVCIVYWSREQWGDREYSGTSLGDVYCSEIYFFADPDDKRDIGGKVVSEWAGRCIHELCHSVFDHRQFMGQPSKDSTHYWDFEQGNLLKAVAEWNIPKHKKQSPLSTALAKILSILSKKKETYRYFEPHEIKGLDKRLVGLLDDVRHKVGVPFTITSGYRTEADNERVGGVKDSKHLTGDAVDVHVDNGQVAYDIIEAVPELAKLHKLKVGFGMKRKSSESGFFHLDIRNINTYWTY